MREIMVQRTLVRATSMLVLLLGASNGLAEEADPARAQFDRGMELYDAEQYEEAAIAFERAYELKPSYKILYNWAQAENESGRYARALEVYQRYLTEGGDEVDPGRVEQVQTEIKRLESLVGTLVVRCDEPGAVVMVDGLRAGETPLDGPITVRLGEREVVVKLEGREIHSEVVRVAGGEQVEIEVAAPREDEQPAPGSVAEQPEDQPPKRVWTWVVLGIGGAAGIAGGILGGVSMKQTEDFIDDCGEHNCTAEREDERDDIKRVSLTADILYGVAAAAVVTGVILFFVEPPDEEGTAVAVTPALQPDGVGVSLTGRF
jgi:hypothetical protein